LYFIDVIIAVVIGRQFPRATLLVALWFGDCCLLPSAKFVLFLDEFSGNKKK
jgi:hypothetical protein